jgi:hypothetical protein
LGGISPLEGAFAVGLRAGGHVFQDIARFMKYGATVEPLLVAGYQGIKQRDAEIPEKREVRLTEALERLVQLYEACGKKEEAARWKEELKSIEKR